MQDVTRDQSIAHFLSTKNIRICIADQYLRVFQCPPVHMWSRINKLIRINLALPNSSRMIITRVMKTIESCLRNNKEIDITRDLREMKQTNVIPLDSLEAQLIADYMETGLSFERVCEEINVDRKKEDKELFTLSTIYGVVRRLEPLHSTVKKRNQGSTNPDHPWCVARKIG